MARTLPTLRLHRHLATSKQLTQQVFMTAFPMPEDACWVKETTRQSKESHRNMCSYLIN